MPEGTCIELARESEAVDFELFVHDLGLHAYRNGTTVEIQDAPSAIGNVVTAWLAKWRDPLVPTALSDGRLALRPPAD